MKVSYKKLWKLLIDKDMKKRDYNDTEKHFKEENIHESNTIKIKYNNIFFF